MKKYTEKVIQTESGEWLKHRAGIYVPLDAGDQIKHTLITAEQREQFDHYNKCIRSEQPFVFAVSHADTFGKGLKFENIARLAMLATYASWTQAANGDNILMIGATKAQRPMTRADMRDILGLKRNTFNRFMDEVMNTPVVDDSGYPQGEYYGFLAEDASGRWMLNQDAFFKGRNRRKFSAYKLYADNIRRLYNAADQADHKHLGKIFALLPYLNYEWNILCRNPKEKDRSKIIPLSLKEICTILGFNNHNAKKLIVGLIESLKQITIDIDGVEQCFCIMTVEKTDTAAISTYEIFTNSKIKSWVTINPFLIYSGSHREEVSNGADRFIRPEDRSKYPQILQDFTMPTLSGERQKNTTS